MTSALKSFLSNYVISRQVVGFSRNIVNFHLRSFGKQFVFNFKMATILSDDVIFLERSKKIFFFQTHLILALIALYMTWTTKNFISHGYGIFYV